MALARECYRRSTAWVVLRIMVIKGYIGYIGIYTNIGLHIYIYIWIDR